LPQLQARYRKKNSSDSQGPQFLGVWLVYYFFNINIEITDYKTQENMPSKNFTYQILALF